MPGISCHAQPFLAALELCVGYLRLWPAGQEIDCSQPGSGWPRVAGHQISGDLDVIGQYAFQSDGALAILVVQDGAIFQASPPLCWLCLVLF